MSSDILYEKIPLDSFEQVVGLVEQLYELPGALQKSRVGSNYAWSAISVGKPWYEYSDPPAELLRVRAIERWRVDENSRKLKAGVVKLALQQVFTGMGRYDEIESDDNNNYEQNETTEQFDVLGVGISKQIIFDSTFTTMKSDVGVQKRLKIGKFASGTSLASTIKLVTPTNIIIKPKHERDLEGMLDRFFYQEPVFELETTDVKPTKEAVTDIAEILKNFIALEKTLALQRV